MFNKLINPFETVVTSDLILFINHCVQQSTPGRFPLGKNEGIITMGQSKTDSFLNHLWSVQDLNVRSLKEYSRST